MHSDARGSGQVLGKQSIAAGLEPATVGSEVQRSSIEPRDRREALAAATRQQQQEGRQGV